MLRQRLKLLDVWLNHWNIDPAWLQLLFYLKAVNTTEERTFHAARVAFDNFHQIANWVPEVAKQTRDEARDGLTEDLVSKMLVVSISVMWDIETVSYSLPEARETCPVFQNDIIDFFSTVRGEFGRKAFKNFTDYTLYYDEHKYYIQLNKDEDLDEDRQQRRQDCMKMICKSDAHGASELAQDDEDRIDARRVAFDYGTIDRRRLLLYGSPYVSNGVLYNILHG